MPIDCGGYAGPDDDNAKAELRTAPAMARELQRRCDVADEMLAKLIDDIGTGSGLASIRQQALDIKNELRGLVRERFSTAP